LFLFRFFFSFGRTFGILALSKIDAWYYIVSNSKFESTNTTKRAKNLGVANSSYDPNRRKDISSENCNGIGRKHILSGS